MARVSDFFSKESKYDFFFFFFIIFFFFILRE